jgi:hypothetical protein
LVGVSRVSQFALQQTPPPGQTSPQVPQLLLSLLVETHVPLQQV